MTGSIVSFLSYSYSLESIEDWVRQREIKRDYYLSAFFVRNSFSLFKSHTNHFLRFWFLLYFFPWKQVRMHLFLAQEVFRIFLILSGLNYDAFRTSRMILFPFPFFLFFTDFWIFFPFLPFYFSRFFFFWRLGSEVFRSFLTVAQSLVECVK